MFGVALIAAFMIVGCRNPPTSFGYTVDHPTVGSLTPAGINVTAIGRDVMAEPTAEVVSELSRIKGLRIIASIGAPSPDGAPNVFEHIRDAASTLSGDIFVADSGTDDIRQFRPDGEFVQRIRGLPGAAPFRSLAAVKSTSNDALLIADRSVDRTRRLMIVSVTPAGQAEGTSVPIDITPAAVCEMKGRFFVREWSDGKGVVHVVTRERGVEASFGWEYPSSVALVTEQLSDGRIACLPHGEGVIVSTFESWSYFYGFDTKGRLLWASRITNFIDPVIKSGLSAAGRPSVLRSWKTDFDLVTAVVPLGRSNLFIVQVSRISSKTRAPSVKPETYLMDGKTGNGWFASSELPHILAARDNRLYGAVQEPFPALVVLSTPIREELNER